MERTQHTVAVLRGGRVASLRRRAFRLTLGRGRGAATHRCVDDAVTIGSHEGNGIVIAHPTVSRFHARIQLDATGHLLTDLDSTNGTTIGGLRVRSAWLPQKAKLAFGDVEGAFELEREETELGMADSDRFGALWGGSAAMRRLFDALARIAASDVTVLVQGETGTGKELVASEIHRHSTRREGPYVVVDCAGLPETLVEAELFGHERGAFTGAQAARAGAFEEADGGTLFLDEIGELPLGLQTKLLRVLEARTVKRIGSNEWRPVDVRVIAATHRDLALLCNQRQFREDLYFRISVVTVRVPPLRERPEDLPLLVGAMLDEADGAGSFQLDESLLASLAARRWSGNVRELRNLVHRVLVLGPEALSDGGGADGAAAPAVAGPSSEEPYKIAKARAVEDFERRYLGELLSRWQGNVARAARAAEVDPAWIFRLVKRHGIELSALRRK